MNRNSISVTLSLLFYMTLFTSCSDENTKETYSLSFEKEYYERPLIGAKNIMIRGGNRDYTVEVNDPDILEIKIDISSPIGMGNLQILPKQKGETTVKVRDNITNDIVNLKIKIIDSYLNLILGSHVQPPYKGNEELFLINNESKSFYLCDGDLKLEHTGSYQFFTENNTPYMELTFQKELEGRVIYKYDLSSTDELMFIGIKKLLDWDWYHSVKNATTKEVSPIIMNATDTETDKTYYFMAGTHDLPEHLLE